MSRDVRRTWAGCGAAVLSLVLCAAMARAAIVAPAQEPEQPESKRPETASPPAGEVAQRVSRDEFRARLERRLKEAREAEKKIEEALAALDRGDPRERIMAILPNQGVFRGAFERAERNDDSERGAPGIREGGGRRPRFGGEGAGGDGPPGGEGERRPGAREITDEDREVIREVLVHAAPELVARLDELMTKDPTVGRRKIAEMFPRMRWMIELRERDPKIYRLRLADLSLARRSLPLAREILTLREKGTLSDDPVMVSKTTELRGLISQQFDNRELVMKAEAEDLRARAAERDDDIDEMSQNREQKIDRLMEGLIKHSDKPGRFEDMLGPGPGGPAGGPGGGPRRDRDGRGPKPKE